MKVLHVIPSISSKRGGPSKAVIEMVRELRSLGIEGYVITTTDNGEYREVKETGTDWIKHNDVPIMVFKCVDSRIKAIREYQVSISLLVWLMKNAHSFDLIHFHSIFSFSTTFGMIVARKKRVPYIIRTIGQLNQWCLRQSGLRKRLMLRLIEKKNLEKAVSIHVTSEIERKDIIQIALRNQTFKLGLGICSICKRDKKKDKAENSGETNFLYLSRIHPKKGLESLLLALSDIDEEDDKWFLHIAGDGDDGYKKFVQEYAENLQVSNRIQWHGHVTGTHKDKLLRLTDWFVLPSSNENFGIAALEAMGYGVPVVLSSEVGISTEVKEYSAGYVYDAKNIHQLKTVLSHCLRMENSEMSDNAIKLVRENFLWSVIGRKLSNYYEGVFNTSQSQQ
jgi:glycosyltransferase involved in cell wall biosynthesis